MTNETRGRPPLYEGHCRERSALNQRAVDALNAGDSDALSKIICEINRHIKSCPICLGEKGKG